MATTVSWCATASLGATGADAAGSSVFAATAAASGVRMTVELPDAPATDTPVDGGGPTAQASLSSLGESIGYAAFPDPGGLVISAPGLIAGLSQSPISPPEYPLFVSSDATTKPNASLDAGPYALSAVSDAVSSHAAATAGLLSDAGAAANVSSIASVTSNAGRVISAGTTDVEGLTIGALTVSQIRSSAQLAQNPDGSSTPTSDLELTGLRVGNNPIQLAPDALNLANAATIPLPIGAAANELLKAQGITVEVLGVRATKGTVVSPALQIRFPSPVPDLGTAIVTIVIGNSVASLSTTTGEGSNHAGSGAVIAPGSGTPTTGGVGDALGSVGIAGTAPGAGRAADIASVSADQTGTALVIPPQLPIDISSLYVVCALAIAVLFTMSQLIRLAGVRARWRS
ncbi:MAG TPA: hypothetical protein VGJ14_09255 [Sporichthyaceae bacterium]